MELLSGTVIAPGRDAPVIEPTPSQSHMVDEVLAFVDAVPKIARTILDAPSAVHSNTVRTPSLSSLPSPTALPDSNCGPTPPIQQLSVWVHPL